MGKLGLTWYMLLGSLVQGLSAAIGLALVISNMILKSHVLLLACPRPRVLPDSQSYHPPSIPPVAQLQSQTVPSYLFALMLSPPQTRYSLGNAGY